MCKKNVNATLSLFANVESSPYQKFDTQFEQILATKNITTNMYEFPSFYAVVNLNLIGTRNKDDKDNYVDMKKTVEIMLRLTKISSIPVEQKSVDLFQFQIDTNIDVKQACFPYINQTKIIGLNQVMLPTDINSGDYVIKILIREYGKDEKWNVQSIYPLTVKLSD